MASRETHHPLAQTNRKSLDHQLSKDDIGHQARVLLNQFIFDRMERDGIEQIPAAEEFQEPGNPTGPPMEHVREIGRALRCIGDELDRDENIQGDGVYNWGRVGSLFYFAYKMAVKAVDKIALIKAIINWVVNFIIENVASWIIDRGGWEAIVEYFGTPSNQFWTLTTLGAVGVAAVYMWKNWK
ncbi:hypothetical protein KUTeg_023557 [Tegillarca granosa]|uniref:Bcl-2 Bcl-2 homology region 1-3 domain-containing protein n=1 Tax=Tegillarca granosa TaxID=220873 RepID=A0ABQ9E2J2_TEGGR|nr:hypothetical protein KUTeg_023557 [Tegillarca granosa]